MICNIWVGGKVEAYLVLEGEEGCGISAPTVEFLRHQAEHLESFERESDWLIKEEELLLRMVRLVEGEYREKKRIKPSPEGEE